MGMTAAIGLTLGASAYGAMTQYGAGQAAGEVGAFNARVADAQADDAIARGKRDEDRHRRDVGRFIGSQRAALAAAGVDVDVGSALDLQLDTAEQGELDALTIRNNAAREAWGYKVQAYNARAGGEIARDTGRNEAIGTILGGASRSAELYYKRGG